MFGIYLLTLKIISYTDTNPFQRLEHNVEVVTFENKLIKGADKFISVNTSTVKMQMCYPVSNQSSTYIAKLSNEISKLFLFLF